MIIVHTEDFRDGTMDGMIDRSRATVTLEYNRTTSCFITAHCPVSIKDLTDRNAIVPSRENRVQAVEESLRALEQHRGFTAIKTGRDEFFQSCKSSV